VSEREGLINVLWRDDDTGRTRGFADNRPEHGVPPEKSGKATFAQPSRNTDIPDQPLALGNRNLRCARKRCQKEVTLEAHFGIADDDGLVAAGLLQRSREYDLFDHDGPCRLGKQWGNLRPADGLPVKHRCWAVPRAAGGLRVGRRWLRPEQGRKTATRHTE